MNDQRILHVLSAKPGGASALYVNNVENEIPSEEMQIIVGLTFRTGKHRSPWCGIVNGYVFIKGYFENKDDSGNEMSFAYCLRTTHIKDGIASFSHDIKKLGYKVNAGTKTCLDNYSRYSNTRIIGYAVVIIALIIALIAFLK